MTMPLIQRANAAPKAPLILIQIMALTVAAYWPGLHGPFLLDDEISLHLVQVWHEGSTSLRNMLFGDSAGTFGRPLAMASLGLNASLLGYSPFAFKAGNLFLHLSCGMAIYALVACMAQRDAKLSPSARLVALGVASAWLLHPLNASTVLYVVQRMAQVSTLFILLGMWVYLILRTRLETGPSRIATAGLFIGIPLITALGFLGKENAILLPALCMVLEWRLFQGPSRPLAIKLFFVGVFAVPTLGGLGLLILRPGGSFAVYGARDFDMWQRLLTETRILCDYLWKIIAPNPPKMGIFFDDFPLSTGLLSPVTTLLAILALMAISAAAWKLRDRIPALLTGWCIFLVGHGMESTILPLELYFEHRNYFPMVGVLFALAGLVTAMVERINAAGLRAGRISVVTGVGIIAVLAFGVHGRAWVWSTPESFALASVQARPASFRANMLLVKEAVEANDRATIDAAMERMLHMPDPRDRSHAYLNRVNIDCMFDGEGNPADLRAAIDAIPPKMTQQEWDIFGILYRNFSNCRNIDDRTLADALDAIIDKAKSQPDSLRFKFQLRNIVANFYARAGDWPSALEQARLSWQPGTEVAGSEVLVRAQLNTGDIDGAERTWREASARASPGNTEDAAGLAWLRRRIDAAEAARASAPKE